MCSLIGDLFDEEMAIMWDLNTAYLSGANRWRRQAGAGMWVIEHYTEENLQDTEAISGGFPSYLVTR